MVQGAFNKIKMEFVGQPCRKCGNPVIMKVPEKKRNGSYYFNYYLYCEKCKTIYLLEEQKVWIKKPSWVKEKEKNEKLKKQRYEMELASKELEEKYFID